MSTSIPPSHNQLLAAASQGDIGGIRMALASGASVDARDYANRTALTLAVDGGHLQAVEYLLSRGAKANRRHFDQAFQGNQKGPMTVLMKHFLRQQPDEIPRGKMLEAAVKFAMTDVLEELLKDVEREELMDSRTELLKMVFKNKLTDCSDKQVLQTLKILEDHGMPVFPESQEPESTRQTAYTIGRETPLTLALQSGRQALVEYLLDRGANPESSDASGRTPLHIAIGNKDRELAALLLDRGADVNARDSSWGAPLHLAARMALREISQLLIGRSAEVDARDRHDRTPLFVLIDEQTRRKQLDQEDKRGTIEVLLAAGADPRAKVFRHSGISGKTMVRAFNWLVGEQPETPYDLAFKVGDGDAVELLLKAMPGKKGKHSRR